MLHQYHIFSLIQILSYTMAYNLCYVIEHVCSVLLVFKVWDCSDKFVSTKNKDIKKHVTSSKTQTTTTNNGKEAWEKWDCAASFKNQNIKSLLLPILFTLSFPEGDPSVSKRNCPKATKQPTLDRDRCTKRDISQCRTSYIIQKKGGKPNMVPVIFTTKGPFR